MRSALLTILLVAGCAAPAAENNVVHPPDPAALPGLSSEQQKTFAALVKDADAAYDAAMQDIKDANVAWNAMATHRESPTTPLDESEVLYRAEIQAALPLLIRAHDLYSQAVDIHSDQRLRDRILDSYFKMVTFRMMVRKWKAE
jgi:hypothetical protein